MTPAGELAPQFKYVPEVVDDDLGVFVPASVVAIDPVASLGYLAWASGFTVAGHSLGGHLAMMMRRLASNRVSHVYNLLGGAWADGLIRAGTVPTACQRARPSPSTPDRARQAARVTPATWRSVMKSGSCACQRSRRSSHQRTGRGCGAGSPASIAHNVYYVK